MAILGALTLFDYGTLVVVVVSALFSTLRGMTREFLGLAGWFVSIALSRLVAPYVEPHIDSFLPIEGFAEILSWAVPFAASVVAWYLFASLISPGLKRAGLGVLDRWLGILFGVLRGIFLVTLIYVGTVMALETEENLPESMTDSQSAPHIRQLTALFSQLLPAGLSIRLDSMLLPAGERLGQTTSEMIDKGSDTLQDTFSLKQDELKLQ